MNKSPVLKEDSRQKLGVFFLLFEQQEKNKKISPRKTVDVHRNRGQIDHCFACLLSFSLVQPLSQLSTGLEETGESRDRALVEKRNGKLRIQRRGRIQRDGHEDVHGNGHEPPGGRCALQGDIGRVHRPR